MADQTDVYLRWHYDADADMAATILPYWGEISAPDGELLSNKKHSVSDRRVVSTW